MELSGDRGSRSLELSEHVIQLLKVRGSLTSDMLKRSVTECRSDERLVNREEIENFERR